MQDTFPQQLLKLRTEKQLSQTELARRLYVSRQAVYSWKRGLIKKARAIDYPISL